MEFKVTNLSLGKFCWGWSKQDIARLQGCKYFVTLSVIRLIKGEVTRQIKKTNWTCKCSSSTDCNTEICGCLSHTRTLNYCVPSYAFCRVTWHTKWFWWIIKDFIFISKKLISLRMIINIFNNKSARSCDQTRVCFNGGHFAVFTWKMSDIRLLFAALRLLIKRDTEFQIKEIRSFILPLAGYVVPSTEKFLLGHLSTVPTEPLFLPHLLETNYLLYVPPKTAARGIWQEKSVLPISQSEKMVYSGTQSLICTRQID